MNGKAAVLIGLATGVGMQVPLTQLNIKPNEVTL